MSFLTEKCIYYDGYGTIARHIAGRAKTVHGYVEGYHEGLHVGIEAQYGG